MELNVQKYLRSGKTLIDLANELSIKSSEYEDLIILNYNQIESPKTHPIVMECRQLILQKGTWNLIFRSFQRFFNYGEAENIINDFNFSKAVALDKIDGSLIGLFWHNNKWVMTTRGVIGGDCQVGTFPLTFKQLFDKTVSQYPGFWKELNEWRENGNDYCYTFELTSPENRIVTPYTDRSLHLLTIRDRNNNFFELSRIHIECFARITGVKYPKKHDFSDIADLLKMAGNVGKLNEGFVCIDYSMVDKNGNFRRLKVKNPAYLAVAHLKESSASSMKSLLYLVMVGESEEFLAYFPEFTKYVNMLKEKWEKYKRDVESDLKMAEYKIDLDRKEYAIWVKDNCKYPSIMFMFKDGKIKCFNDWLNIFLEQKGNKIGSYMIKILDIKDIEWKNES